MIILTGGAGFIGSCFLWRLNQEGIYDIIVVDNLEGGLKWKNLLGKRFLDFIHKDDFLGLLEEDKIKGVKKIIHLGACSSTVLDNPNYFLKNNYEYSKRLAIWALDRKVHFIYASSAATYGDGKMGYDDDERILPRLRPLNMYGYSKHLFDLWLWQSGLTRRVVGLKFFNVFGPNEYHKGEMASLICRNYQAISAGAPFRLFKSYNPEYKDGQQKRDFIYVKDAVDVLFYFYRHPDKRGIYNLGTGKAHSWNELAEALFEALGRPPFIEYIEMPAYLRQQYQYFTQAKMEKLRKAGYRKAFTPLKDAVSDYISYLKDNAYL